MDINGYVDRIESNIEDPVALARIEQDADADAALSVEDREFISGRVGGYLADLGRESGDEVIYEDDEDASAS